MSEISLSLHDRDYRLFLSDILECCRRVEEYTSDLDFEEFLASGITVDATLRNLEVMGEAARYIPDEVRDQLPDVDWSSVIGMRNVIIHNYIGVDYRIVWRVVNVNVPELREAVQTFLDQNMRDESPE